MNLTVITAQGPRTLPAQPGQTLLNALRDAAGLAPQAPCGGRGTCKKCTVYLLEDGQEQAVLACQTPVRAGMRVRVPEGHPLAVEDAAQMVCRPEPARPGWGIACDIGTTTVVCRLVDLTTGTCTAVLGEGNAQRAYGADVISRIQAASEGKLPALTAAIRRQLADMLRRLCAEAGISLDEVQEMTVAANTTMCHLLQGLSPEGLGKAPFTPLSHFGDNCSAAELELPFAGTVYIAPAVSGYVGGDITAGLLATGMDQAQGPVLLIDVGTNGEMALGCGTHFLCCSTAAGPAFEGAQIRHGMTAAPGAISSVTWSDGKLHIGTIGGIGAQGICGSGLIDAAAVMLDLGALEETGRLLDPEEDDIPEVAQPYLFLDQDGAPAFRLTDRVWVTQADIRKLQLGKGAIAAGVQVLLDAYGVPLREIGGLLLAGGFGSYIRPESAARIGLIPEELLPVTRAVGNTAALGAQMALVSVTARQRLRKLRDAMAYLELSGLAAFNDAYVEAMLFPETE